MKKLITLILLLVIVSVQAQEEELSNKKWFAKAGLMLSSVSSYDNFGTGNLNSDGSISPYIGFGRRFGEKVIFQPEILLTRYKLDIGGSYSEGSSSYSFTESIRYTGGVFKISIPLAIKFSVSEKASLLTGLNTSILFINKNKGVVNTSSSLSGSSYNDQTKFDKSLSWNPAIILGGEYKLNSKIFFEARFNYVPEFIYDISEDSNIYTGNIGIKEKSAFQLGVGYNLF